MVWTMVCNQLLKFSYELFFSQQFILFYFLFMYFASILELSDYEQNIQNAR